MLTGFVESAHTGMTQLTKTNPQFIPVESVAGGKLGYDKGSSNNSNSSSSDQNLRQEHPADSIDAVMQNYVLRTNGRTHYRVYAFIKITATQLISLVYYTNGMVVFTKFLEEFKKMIAAAVPAEILLGVNAVTSNSTASNSVVPAFPVTPSSASLTRSEKEILPIIPVQQLQLLQNPSRYDDEFDYSLTDSPALVPPPQLASSIIISPPIPTSAVSARTSFLPFKSNQSNNINNDSSNSSSSSAVKLRGLDDSDEDEDVVASRVMISGVSISNNETTPLQKPSIITTATSPGSPIISSLCDQLLLPTTIVPDAPFFSSKSCVGSMEGLYFGEAMGASRLNRSTKKMENAWMQVYLLLTHSGNRACITIPKFGGLSQLDDALLESLMSSSECNHGTYSIENDGDRLVIQWTGERDFTTVVGQPCLRRSIASVIDDDTIVFARREFTTLSDFRLLRVKSLPSALLKAASPGATPRSSLTNMIATTSGGGGGRDVNNSNGSTGSLHNNINARFQSPVSWSGKFAHSTATFPDKYYIEFFNNGEVLVTDEYILSQFSCVAVYAEEHDGIMVDESKLAAVNALGRWRYTCWHYTVEISSPTNEVQKFTVFLKRSGESAGVSSSGSGGGNVKDSGGGGSSKLVHQPRRAASLSDKIFGEFILDGNLYIRKG